MMTNYAGTVGLKTIGDFIIDDMLQIGSDKIQRTTWVFLGGPQYFIWTNDVVVID